MNDEQTALNCYLAAFVLLGRYGAALWPERADRIHQTMIRMRGRVAFHPAAETLDKSLGELEQSAGEILDAAAVIARARGEAYSSLLNLMINAADDFELRDHFYLEQLSAARKRLEAELARGSDAQLRDAVSRHIAELATFLQAMGRDSAAVFGGFRRELQRIPKKLEQAGGDPGVDALTGLATRSAMERELGRRIEAGDPFSLAVLRIAGLSSISQLYGERAADSLLRQVSDRVASRIRLNDAAARWRVDEIAVSFDGPPDVAERRAAELVELLKDRYPILARSREWKVEVEVASSIRQWRAGQSLDELCGKTAPPRRARSAAGQHA